jgi:hypothetical protein
MGRRKEKEDSGKENEKIELQLMMAYRVYCNQCDYKVRAKNMIEATHLRNKHFVQAKHFEVEFERIA